MSEKGKDESAGNAKTMVTPDQFDGCGDWDEWAEHFNDVAAVNGWTEDDQLKWLPVALSWKARSQFRQLPADVRRSFQSCMAALKERFDPPCTTTMYRAELEKRKRDEYETWSDVGCDVRRLVNKAYPSLPDDAKEVIGVNKMLNILDRAELSLLVRQRNPTTIDQAVCAALEVESYLTKDEPVLAVGAKKAAERSEDDMAEVHKSLKEIQEALQTISSRMDALEFRCPNKASVEPGTDRRQKCFKCGKSGHFARNCWRR